MSDEHKAAGGRECYIAMLEMDDHQQTMCIGEQQTVAEPVEELKK